MELCKKRFPYSESPVGWGTVKLPIGLSCLQLRNDFSSSSRRKWVWQTVSSSAKDRPITVSIKSPRHTLTFWETLSTCLMITEFSFPLILTLCQCTSPGVWKVTHLKRNGVNEVWVVSIFPSIVLTDYLRRSLSLSRKKDTFHDNVYLFVLDVI